MTLTSYRWVKLPILDVVNICLKSYSFSRPLISTEIQNSNWRSATAQRHGIHWWRCVGWCAQRSWWILVVKAGVPRARTECAEEIKFAFIKFAHILLNDQNSHVFFGCSFLYFPIFNFVLHEMLYLWGKWMCTFFRIVDFKIYNFFTFKGCKCLSSHRENFYSINSSKNVMKCKST